MVCPKSNDDQSSTEEKTNQYYTAWDNMFIIVSIWCQIFSLLYATPHCWFRWKIATTAVVVPKDQVLCECNFWIQFCWFCFVGAIMTITKWEKFKIQNTKSANSITDLLFVFHLNKEKNTYFYVVLTIEFILCKRSIHV